MTQLRDVLKACDYPALSRVQPHKTIIQNLPCPMIAHQGQSKGKGPFAIIHTNRAYDGAPQSAKDEYTHGNWLCQECQREGNASDLAELLEIELPMPPHIEVENGEQIWQLDTGAPRYRYLSDGEWLPLHKDAVLGRLRRAGYSVDAARAKKPRLPIAVSEVFDARTTSRVIQKGSRTYLNSYKGLPLEPKEGKFDLIEKCLRYLVNGDDGGYEYLLDWLANPLQSIAGGLGPKRNLSAVVFFGAQSTGKGMMFGGGGVMERLYGLDLHTEIGQRDIEDSFEIGPILSGQCFFLSLNEVAVPGARNEKTLNKLKRYITESKLSLRDMRKVARQSGPGDIAFNMALMSNSYEPVRLEPSDRRYSCFLQPERMPQDLTDELVAQKIAGWPEAAAFYYHLLHRQVTTTLAIPYDNQARKDLMESSLPSQDIFAKEITECGLRHVMSSWIGKQYPKDEGDFIGTVGTNNHTFVHTRTLAAAYQQWCKDHGIRHPVRSLSLKRAVLDTCDHKGEGIGTVGGIKARGIVGLNEGEFQKKEGSYRDWQDVN